jgi:hypothetical protein
MSLDRTTLTGSRDFPVQRGAMVLCNAAQDTAGSGQAARAPGRRVAL